MEDAGFILPTLALEVRPSNPNTPPPVVGASIGVIAVLSGKEVPEEATEAPSSSVMIADLSFFRLFPLFNTVPHYILFSFCFIFRTRRRSVFDFFKFHRRKAPVTDERHHSFFHPG